MRIVSKLVATTVSCPSSPHLYSQRRVFPTYHHFWRQWRFCYYWVWHFCQVSWLPPNRLSDWTAVTTATLASLSLSLPTFKSPRGKRWWERCRPSWKGHPTYSTLQQTGEPSSRRLPSSSPNLGRLLSGRRLKEWKRREPCHSRMPTLSSKDQLMHFWTPQWLFNWEDVEDQDSRLSCQPNLWLQQLPHLHRQDLQDRPSLIFILRRHHFPSSVWKTRPRLSSPTGPSIGMVFLTSMALSEISSIHSIGRLQEWKAKRHPLMTDTTSSMLTFTTTSVIHRL